MNAINQDIETLVQKELESANKKFPSTFRSRHEAYGVMLEEFEEALGELGECEYCLNTFKKAMKLDGMINEENFLLKMKEHAENLMAEAGQLAAMAQKTLDSEKEW